MVSCQKGPTRHAYAWQIRSFWQDTLDICIYRAQWGKPYITWVPDVTCPWRNGLEQKKCSEQRIQYMMTSSNGNIFRVTGPLCGEFTGPGEFPTQRPVTRSFDVFCDLRLNKRLSKQPWGWWFETLSRPLWRQCYELSRRWLICPW